MRTAPARRFGALSFDGIVQNTHDARRAIHGPRSRASRACFAFGRGSRNDCVGGPLIEGDATGGNGVNPVEAKTVPRKPSADDPRASIRRAMRKKRASLSAPERLAAADAIAEVLGELPELLTDQ